MIVDNDFGGDCDGLFALAHQLLSPSVEVRGVIGSHNYPGGFYGYPGSADHACQLARELIEVLRLEEDIPVYQGADSRIEQLETPVRSAAAEFIVREAMRDDAPQPLYLACGAGLTDVASAYLIEPRIAGRVRLIWIGGPEYDNHALPPPGNPTPEYNLGIDLKAAQVVFNHSEIPVWQVPRNAYRQALVSHAELRSRMSPKGRLGAFLSTKLHDLMQRADYNLGEAYVLGDNPLVLLTALQSAWETDPSSSRYELLQTPVISDTAAYRRNPNGRPIRVYKSLDLRLMFEDFYAKVGAVGEGTEASARGDR